MPGDVLWYRQRLRADPKTLLMVAFMGVLN